MLLQIENVSKTYTAKHGSVTALDNASLSVDAGQFAAVRGPSGCGKSTLLLTIGGLLQPDQGRVLIGGENPYDMSGDARAAFRGRKLGFVFQQFHLVPYLSVLDNVLAPALAIGGTSDDLRNRAKELVAHFGLSDRSRHVPGELSSGERQRTVLARALLNKPDVLLADEPTGNLDHDNADAVLSYMTEFAAEGGAILLVTHDDRAVTHAHHVYHMQKGRMLSADGDR